VGALSAILAIFRFVLFFIMNIFPLHLLLEDLVPLCIIENEIFLASRQIRILEVFRILPRVLGTAKAAKSTAHIVKGTSNT